MNVLSGDNIYFPIKSFLLLKSQDQISILIPHAASDITMTNNTMTKRERTAKKELW